MPKKKYKPEEIAAKLPQVDVQVSQGASIASSIGGEVAEVVELAAGAEAAKSARR